MCGIVGILNLTGNRAAGGVSPVEITHLDRMLHSIRHRGPDQVGIYTFQDEQSCVGLGSARLSIIDLGGGQQPIGNEDGSLWIVFNGEIFNYVELRAELEWLGHTFATDSDTEVILHLYEEYGTECVQQLNGQFVFAIWDERQHALWIVRDRLGVRPLYYMLQEGTLIFASEIKAIFSLPGVRAELDEVTLDQIFTFWSPLPPRTAFKNIHTLPPGHWLTVGARQELQIERYWRLQFPQTQNRRDLSEDDAVDELRYLLIDATQIRLRADVPVGAYLSGGLDSSTIAALIHHYTNRTLETFSIGFADESYDESAFQRAMAKKLKTRHHAIQCTSEEIGNVFPEVVWHTETPLLRTSPAPLYLLSKLVHEHGFKVVLTGEGADEFLAGYNIFKEAKIRRRWAKEPDSLVRPALLRKLYPYIANLAQSNDAYLRQFFGKRLGEIDAPDYSHQIRWANTSRAKRFFSQEMRQTLTDSARSSVDNIEIPTGFADWEPQARAQYLEITIFLSEYLLSSQGDRVAMAHSVEGRFPFLDYRVVEFCNQLPPHFKLRGLTEKYLLKRAMRDLLPEEIWSRPKRPYRAPIQHSFFPNGKPLAWVGDLLSPAELGKSGYFEPLAVANLLKKLDRSGELGETDEMALTGILSTQLVHQQFVAAQSGSYTHHHAVSYGAERKVVSRGQGVPV
jgi:asparagine synthase (glutamine-hydrolysing)